VHFVDRNRVSGWLTVATAPHPVLIAPTVGRWCADDGRRIRTVLELPRIRIGLQDDRAAMAIAELEFVPGARRELRYEQAPDTA
jgi:hypothetical protein